MKYILILMALSFSLVAFAEGEVAASSTNTDGTEACARPAVVDGSGAESGGTAPTAGATTPGAVSRQIFNKACLDAGLVVQNLNNLLDLCIFISH